MKIPAMLVTCHNALILIRDGVRPLVLHSGLGVYYGITWSFDRLYVVARSNQPSRMLTFRHDMLLRDPPPFVHMGPRGDGPHQAHYDLNSEVLHVANTQFNRIERWKVCAAKPMEPIYFEEPVGCKDVDHINSVWFNGSNWYVSEHRKDLMPKRIRVCDPDWKLVRTIELYNESLCAGPTHRGLHNVWVDNAGSLYTLSSSTMLVWDSGMRAREYDFEPYVKPNVHYLRGFAADEGWLYIGASEAKIRDERAYSVSRVLVVNRLDFKVEHEVYLSQAFGQIMEVRLLHGDGAHNGLDCPLEV